MGSKDIQSGSQLRARLGAASIKSKLTALALLVTLVPAMTLGILFYENNRALLKEKVSQDLTNIAENRGAEYNRWVKRQSDELRVIGSSYIFNENLADAIASTPGASEQIREYMQLVSSRLSSVEAMAVYALDGQVISTSEPTEWQVPPRWYELAQSSSQMTRESKEMPVTQPYRHEDTDRFVILAGYVVSDLEEDKPVGMLVGRLNFEEVTQNLNIDEAANVAGVYLMDASGQIVATGGGRFRLGDHVNQELRERFEGRKLVDYAHHDETLMVGAWVAATDDAGYSIVTEQLQSVAYAEIREFTTKTATFGSLLILLVAVIAYLTARGLTGPLVRLSRGAQQVALGNLDVEVEVRGNDEIANLARVFNDMVKRITEAQEQMREQNRRLEVLSNTDPLTGLFNRQHMSAYLNEILERSEHEKLRFALLMIDLDHFKQLNDQHGHLAGDEALRQMAANLRNTLRDDDYAARFGGEEFLVILPDAKGEVAMKTAERLRKSLAAKTLEFDTGKVTVTLSVGIAVYPESGRTMDDLIRAADEALYAAKDGGRDRCELAPTPSLRAIS